MTDAQVVARVLAGDDDAYAIIIERYRTRLGRYARQMLGNDADAEEVVQDAFLRAYRSLARCRDPDRLGSWLLAITANRCRTASRRRWQRDRHHSALALHVATERSSNPDHSETLAWRETLQRALLALDTKQREAFLMHHVEGISYIEMAEATGSGVSALKMRVKRARERLRAMLEEAGYG
jgi:RNA polymerase sigma-70 factor (ECF subfamily)